MEKIRELSLKNEKIRNDIDNAVRKLEIDFLTCTNAEEREVISNRIKELKVEIDENFKDETSFFMKEEERLSEIYDVRLIEIVGGLDEYPLALQILELEPFLPDEILLLDNSKPRYKEHDLALLYHMALEKTRFDNTRRVKLLRSVFLVSKSMYKRVLALELMGLDVRRYETHENRALQTKLLLICMVVAVLMGIFHGWGFFVLLAFTIVVAKEILTKPYLPLEKGAKKRDRQ